MLNLSLLDLRPLLLSSLVLLLFEIDVDEIIFWNLKVLVAKLVDVVVMSSELRLLAFEDDTEVLIVATLISKVDLGNSSSDDASCID